MKFVDDDDDDVSNISNLCIHLGIIGKKLHSDSVLLQYLGKFIDVREE